MLREANLKLIHYVDEPSQLFDLAKDPDETVDLAGDIAHAEALATLERRLLERCHPREVDERARADQQAKAAHWGGNDAIRREGLLVYTPPPGIEPQMQASTVAS